MHESLRLYDTALQLLAQEAEALEKEDADTMAALCEKRTAIMNEAWEKRGGCESAALLEKLEMLRSGQITLAERTGRQKEALRLELQNSKKQSTRLAGYGKVVSNRDTAFTVIKEG